MNAKKPFLAFAMLLLATFLLNAQQEIPMFFDHDLGLNTGNQFGSFSRYVAYSPDGNRIAMTISNNNIAIFDAATGRKISRLTGHRDIVTGIVFSPNGRQLASRSPRERTVKIWNPASGELLLNIMPQAPVLALAYSPDGSRLAGGYSASESNQGIKIWNTANGSEIRTIELTAGISSVAYSPDGRQILAATRDGIKLIDAGNGQTIRTINGGTSFQNAVYSRNGQHIAATVTMGGIHIFNIQTGQELRVISAALTPYHLLYNPDGRQLFVNGWTDDGNTHNIQVFDPETGRELRRFNNENFVTAISPDGRRILTDSDTFEVKIGDATYGAWYATVLDAATGRAIGTIGYGPLNAGARAYADLQIARFLGDTAAAGRHEAMLQFIVARGYATRSEVEAFYRNGLRGLVSEVVDEEFNRVSFSLRKDNRISYNAVLTRNSQSGQYVLNYGGIETNGETRTVTSNSVDVLLSEMRNGKNKDDFSLLSLDTVRAQAALIPAVRLGDTTVSNIKNRLTNFCTSPNINTYNDVRDVYAAYSRLRASRNNDAEAYAYASDSYIGTLGTLSDALAGRVGSDVRANPNVISPNSISSLMFR